MVSFFGVNLIASILPDLATKSHFLPIFFLGLQFLLTALLPLSVYIPPIIKAVGVILIPFSDKSKSVLVNPISQKSSLPQKGKTSIVLSNETICGNVFKSSDALNVYLFLNLSTPSPCLIKS